MLMVWDCVGATYLQEKVTFFFLLRFIWKNNVILKVVWWQFLMFPEVKTNTVKNIYCIFISKEREHVYIISDTGTMKC